MTNLVLAFEYMKLSTFPKCKYMIGNMPKPTITIQHFLHTRISSSRWYTTICFIPGCETFYGIPLILPWIFGANALYWANTILGEYNIGECNIGRMQYWANAILGEYNIGRIQYWANAIRPYNYTPISVGAYRIRPIAYTLSHTPKITLLQHYM